LNTKTDTQPLWAVTPEKIAEAVRRIVAAANPVCVILSLFSVMSFCSMNENGLCRFINGIHNSVLVGKSTGKEPLEIANQPLSETRLL
jgi:hypothetical protein